MTPQQLKINNIILLVCLVLLITVFPVLQSQRIWFKHMVLAAIILSSIFCLNFGTLTRRILMSTGLANIALLLFTSYNDHPVLNLIDYIMAFLFMALIVGFIVRHIARKKNVDWAIIVSSINGYLLLGVLWALLLNTVHTLEIKLLASAPALRFPENVLPDFYDFVYFSFVTMTTLGYGDIVPVSPAARSLALLISISGQFYMTLLVAMLVGKYLGSRKDA